jgi:cation diffusion facilitator family transporter
MSHEHHTHSHAVALTAGSLRAFQLGIGMNMLFVLVEAAAGILYDSVALLSDAGHNLADVASLLLSYIAFKLSHKQATSRFTYGYKKTTVLAALFNAIILLVALGMLGYESFQRLQQPPAVQGDTIAWVAAAGIIVNGASALLFFKKKDTDLNIKGAYLHLLTDALVSLGVVAGGLIIARTSWFWLDPVIGVVIMIVVLISTWSLLTDSLKMSVDAVPTGIDLDSITEVMLKVPHVVNVHHVHIWPLSTTENALTAHVIVQEDLSFDEKLKVVRTLKHELEHHQVQHSTIELESNTMHCTREDMNTRIERS